jgi:Kef-type K+ transport system membrane component KefB
MDHFSEIFLGLFAVFLGGQVGAELAQRLKMPAVVGEIAAGCILGPSLLGWVRIGEPLEVLAEFGAILLLFSVGLETRLEDLGKVGRAASLAAVGGVALPFVLGALWGKLEGLDTSKSLFVAAALVATSAGITARVLKDMGVLDHVASQTILGAAVIDDILAMLFLAVITALQAEQGPSILNLAFIALQAVGFVVLVAIVAPRLMRRSSRWLEVPVNPLSPLTISLAVCLGLAVAATFLGLAAIIGAFLAGMAAAETRQRETLEHQMQPILALLVPFFFVVTGAKVPLEALGNPAVLGGVAVITVLAIAGKLIGSGMGALSLGARNALIVGVGMVPRGEVGIIIASLGQQAGVLSGSTYAIIIAMSLLTAIVAPPGLAALFGSAHRPAAGLPGPGRGHEAVDMGEEREPEE